MGSSPHGTPNPGARKPPRKRARLPYERRVSLFALLVALPGLLVGGVFIWLQLWTLESKFALMFTVLFLWWLLAMALQEQTTRPLQTLANVISALREEDYSFRARGAATDDALGELSLEVNAWPICSQTSGFEPLKRPHCCAAWSKRLRFPYLLLILIRFCAW